MQQSANLHATLHELHTTYRQAKAAIESQLTAEIEVIRCELQKLNPHSRVEAERWSAGVYRALLERRVRLLQLLFPDSRHELNG